MKALTKTRRYFAQKRRDVKEQMNKQTWIHYTHQVYYFRPRALQKDKSQSANWQLLMSRGYSLTRREKSPSLFKFFTN